jgi:hypothetical protein
MVCDVAQIVEDLFARPTDDDRNPDRIHSARSLRAGGTRWISDA